MWSTLAASTGNFNFFCLHSFHLHLLSVFVIMKMNLNRDYHLEAFNNLTAPGEDPTKTNCFQLLSVHLENPSPPLNLLNSLFSLHPELDYMVTLLPRWLQLSAFEVTLRKSVSDLHPVPARCLHLYSPGSVRGWARNHQKSCIWFTRLPFARVSWWSLPPIPICLAFGHLQHRLIKTVRNQADIPPLSPGSGTRSAPRCASLPRHRWL